MTAAPEPFDAPVARLADVERLERENRELRRVVAREARILLATHDALCALLDGADREEGAQ